MFTLSITMEHGWAEVVAVPGAVGSVAAEATVDTVSHDVWHEVFVGCVVWHTVVVARGGTAVETAR